MKPDTPTRDRRNATIFDRTSVTTHKSIEVVEFRSLQKGESLKGFVTLELPSSLVLHDCSYHQRGGDGASRWIGLPSKPYKKPDGSSSWARMVDFSSREAYDKFQVAALEAMNRYFARKEAEAQPGAASQARLIAEARKPREQVSPEIDDSDIGF